METNTESFEQMYKENGIGKLKAFGAAQIILGILCALVSVAGIVIDGINMDKTCHTDYWYSNYYQYYLHLMDDCKDINNAPILLGLDIGCLLFSTWFIVTGIFPFCMKENRQEKLSCLKRTHMIFSILGSTLFIPAVTALASVATALREDGKSSGMLALPSVLTVLAVSEEIVAIVAASYSCCCSSSKTTMSSTVYPMVYNYALQPIVYLPNSQIPASGMQTNQNDPQPFPNISYPYQLIPHQLVMIQQPNPAIMQQQQQPATMQHDTPATTSDYATTTSPTNRSAVNSAF